MTETARFAKARRAGGAAIFVLFMGSTVLTPVYSFYRETYGLGSLQLTLIYAVYVIGNLAALLFLWRLSDAVGRRRIVLAGLGLAALSSALFLIAPAVAWLYAARIVNGLAVGIGSGAATAWITESLPEERRPLASSVMTAFNFAGLAAGPICAGLLVQYAPWPLRLPFAVYLGLILAVAGFALTAAETLRQDQDKAISLKPKLGVPAGLWIPFAAPAAAGFASMSEVGYYAALGPTMIRQALKIENHALSGLIVAELFAISTLTILATRKMPPRAALLIGLLATPAGLLSLLAAQNWASTAVMLAATAITGAASAFGYRGGLGSVTELAPPDRRAGMASAYFVCCFLGNALPVIGVGALSQAMDLATASRIFALLLSALALAAFFLAWRRKG
jgi:MFS family permease